jgi:hypothetical protein
MVLWLGLGIIGQVFADTAFVGEKATDQLKFGGDLRVRHEDFFNKGVNAVDRHRERFRLRFGVTGQLQDFTAGFKIASGTGEQTSTNQTFGNAFNQKGLYIDQAYVQWKALESLKLTGGRMPNPIWRTYSSDVMWDGDINPEGYAEQLTLPAGDRLSLFANFAQLPINESSSSNGDPWVFAHQIGANTKLAEDTTARFGITYYGFINERKGVFLSTAAADSANIQEANTRVAGSAQLASAFQIIDLTAELATHVGPLPLSVQGDYVKNMAPGNALLAAAKANGQTQGYQVGFVVGKAKTQGNWEFAYFRKWLQANATISDWADSDFGNGGTNRKGHIFWLAYAVRDYVTVQGKYFITSKLNPELNSSTPFGATHNNFGDINRFQADVVVKF